jgi:nitrous oxide reductase accessory protein NosL
MLDYERLNPDVRIVERYVTDYQTRRLIAAESAAYLFGATVQTPMGSATVAFADVAGAEEGKKTLGGEPVSYKDLKALRQRVMEERYGKPAR